MSIGPQKMHFRGLFYKVQIGKCFIVGNIIIRHPLDITNLEFTPFKSKRLFLTEDSKGMDLFME